MIKIIINDEHILQAEKLFEFKKLNNSITEGEGNLSGALGEIIACEYFKGIQENTYDYDIVVKGRKIDVKTKRYTSKFTPELSWNLNIPDFNIHQKCDYYLFVGMSDNHEVCYLYGSIEKDKFYEIAKFGKKGQVDPRGNGIWTFRADCYNILVSQLTKQFNKKNGKS